ncbi:ATP-binding domain-containing protein [Streptomyces hygroscopicus]|uniref:ATP-binding domain-containing protein n=1 Tax=Streptomyces hygroscopicus TaxID=1912 RepID=UPI000826296C
MRGELALGATVALRRKHDSAPAYFREHLAADDAVVMRAFNSQEAQDIWVARQVQKNLDEDELEHDDILIVLPDAYRAKSRAPRLMRTLRQHGIPSHLVGVNTSADTIFVRDSVALAHIFRAKGNEAPMVYVIDAQYATRDYNTMTRRNTLFTAITRSRAWVRIVGYGSGMDVISSEIDTVREKNFQLEFKIPSQAALDRMRQLNRNQSADSRTSVRRATEGLQMFMEAYEAEEIDLEDIPPALRTRLMIKLREELPGDDA